MIIRLAFVLAIFGAPILQAASQHAIVVDDRAFRIVDLTGNVPVQTIRLPEGRQHVVFSADGTRVAVFSVPDNANAAATFIDASTLAPLNTIDLGRGVNDVLMYGESRMYILTRGAPAELWDLDFRTGQVLQHRTFDRDATELDLMPDGKTAVVYSAGDEKKQKTALMRFIDRDDFNETARVELPPGASAPLAFRGARQFYSIDPGNDQTGKLFVFATDKPALVAALDVGADAKIVAIQPATNRIFVTSHNASTEGYIHIFRDAAPEKIITLEFEPGFLDLAADARSGTVSGRSFHGVAGIHAMRHTSLDLSDLTPSGENTVSVRTLQGATQQAMESTGRALGRCCNDVALEHTIRIADRIGRAAAVLEGSRTASVLAAGAVIGGMATSIMSDERIPAHISEPSLFTDFYESQRGTAIDGGGYFVRGPFAYQLDNHEHLFVRNAADGRRVAKIDVDDGLQETVLLGADRTLAVIGDDRVAVIDLQKNRRSDYFKAGGDVLGVAVSPDGNYGAVIGEDKVSVIDGGEGAVTFAFRDIRGRAQVVFLP